MTGPTSRLMVYDGPVAIGEVEDHGRGRVIAYQHTATTRVKIGEFPDRVSAMRAISALAGAAECRLTHQAAGAAM